jgi:hypothetical protein
MRPDRIVFLLLAVTPFSFAAGKVSPPQDPIAWGMLSHNTGCVIFEEGRKTTGMFWGVAVTTKTSGKLTVIEAQNYTLNQKVFLETQDVMDDMMRRAQTDHIKYVKIPEKYPPDLLDKARAMCKAGE